VLPIFALIDDVEEGGKAQGISTICALIDIVVSVCLLLGIQWQSDYLPPKGVGCAGASSWQNSTGQPSLFQTIGDLRNATAQDTCEYFTSTGKLAMALTYALLFLCTSSLS
jgi:hypothetical protein